MKAVLVVFRRPSAVALVLDGCVMGESSAGSSLHFSTQPVKTATAESSGIIWRLAGVNVARSAHCRGQGQAPSLFDLVDLCVRSTDRATVDPDYFSPYSFLFVCCFKERGL